MFSFDGVVDKFNLTLEHAEGIDFGVIFDLVLAQLADYEVIS